MTYTVKTVNISGIRGVRSIEESDRRSQKLKKKKSPGRKECLEDLAETGSLEALDQFLACGSPSLTGKGSGGTDVFG